MKKGIAFTLGMLMIFSTTTISADTTTSAVAEPTAISVAADTKDLTLENALTLALANNANIVQCDVDIAIAKNALETAKYYIDHGNYKETFDLKSILHKLRNENKESYTYKSMITIPQKKYNNDVESAERKRADTVRSVTMDIVKQFYGLQQAVQSFEIYQKNLALAETLDKQTILKEEKGTVSKQDVLASALTLIKAQNDLAVAEKKVQDAKMAFNVTLGRDVMTEFTLNGSLAKRAFDPGDVKKAIENAFANSSSLKDLTFNKEIADFDRGFAGIGYSTDTYPYIEKKLKADKAALALKNAFFGIEMDVRSKFNDLNLKTNEIARNQQALTNAQDSLRISKISFDADVAIKADIDRASNNELSAELALSQSILDYNVAVLSYLNAQGLDNTTAQANIAK